MIFGLAGLFGLVIGSFLNVAIHRVPRGESIVWPGSRCPACGTEIKATDNLPVLSFLLLRGRCRSCKAPISVRYPAVEALTCVLFVAAAYEFGFGLPLISALVLICALIVLAGIDLEHRLLPNVIVAPAAILGLAISVLQDPERWWVYLASSVAIAGGLLALALAYPGGMGMGDVKMGGMLGAFLGPYAALAIFLGAVVGAATAGVLMAAGRMDRRYALPFGVFMAVGAVVTLLIGPELWEIYLDLLWPG